MGSNSKQLCLFYCQGTPFPHSHSPESFFGLTGYYFTFSQTNRFFGSILSAKRPENGQYSLIFPKNDRLFSQDFEFE